MTNRSAVTGDRVKGRAIHPLDRTTTAVISTASACLAASWFLH